MLDFTEISKDGTQFELLTREILFQRGLDVNWSGVGPDGGKDLICTERIDSTFGVSTRRWLIQCKHNAHSGKVVGTADIKDIVDTCSHHNVDGYVVVASTTLSAGLVTKLENISVNKNILTSYIDASTIERLLDTPQNYNILQRFFPKSASATDWKVNFTDAPNHFVVNHRGYNFHLTNRIGSNYQHHLTPIENRLDEMERINAKLKKGHFLRPRCFWYNDKSCEYFVYYDYMVPDPDDQEFDEKSIARSLGDQDVLDWGTPYSFDIKVQKYLAQSDHYDKDHYDYYSPYLGSFLIGQKRPKNRADRIAFETFPPRIQSLIEDDNGVILAGADAAYNEFYALLKNHFGDGLIRGENAYPEALDYVDRGDLSMAYTFFNTEFLNIDTCKFIFKNSVRKQVYKLVKELDQGFGCAVFCSEGFTHIIGENGRCDPSFDDKENRLLFLTFKIMFPGSAKDIRDKFNLFFTRMSSRIREEKLL